MSTEGLLRRRSPQSRRLVVWATRPTVTLGQVWTRLGAVMLGGVLARRRTVMLGKSWQVLARRVAVVLGQVLVRRVAFMLGQVLATSGRHAGRTLGKASHVVRSNNIQPT